MINIIAISVSIDALLVTISNCILFKDNKNIYKQPIYFGVLQTLMVFFGYLIGDRIYEYVQGISSFVIFCIFSVLGLKMILEAFQEEEKGSKKLTDGVLFAQSIATSIDALAVGVSLALMQINVILASLYIGFVTCLICTLGIFFATKIKNAESFQVIFGIILIIVGITQVI